MNINTLAVGDTFTMDGIEWRKLMKQGTQTLIIAEHTLQNTAMHTAAASAWQWLRTPTAAGLNLTNVTTPNLNGSPVYNHAAEINYTNTGIAIRPAAWVVQQ